MAKTNLGAYLRKTREEQGVSLSGLARSIGISPSTLSEIELGKRNASNALLVKIARGLKVDVGLLQGLDYWAALKDFREMLELDPRLSLAFTRAVQAVKSGQTEEGALAQHLQNFSKNSKR
jgi:transcriptional regulator with XRE-family HTH domain